MFKRRKPPPKKKQQEQAKANNFLLDIITSMGLEITRNSLVIGENTGRIYGIVKYSQKAD